MTRTVNHTCPMSGKFRYAGPSEAGYIARKVTARNIKEGQHNPMVTAYSCEHCMGWHIGHPKRADRAKS